MLLFAHLGLTLGVARTLDNSLVNHLSQKVRSFLHISQTTRIKAWKRTIDYRMVLIGALLPDIMDKSIGMILFREFFQSGRIFGHTALFIFITLSLGLYLHYRHRKLWLLILSLCSGFHLILDEMWFEPKTLLWPIYGLGFERYDLPTWLPNMLYALKTDPFIFGPEIAGAIILLGFGFRLTSTKRVNSFLKSGAIS